MLRVALSGPGWALLAAHSAFLLIWAARVQLGSPPSWRTVLAAHAVLVAVLLTAGDALVRPPSSG